jgi:hypothetical protein
VKRAIPGLVLLIAILSFAACLPATTQPMTSPTQSPDATILLSCPVRGEWAIRNPPGHPALAIDLLAVDAAGRPYPGGHLWRHLMGRIDAEHTYTWNAPVHAPLAGVVAAVGEEWPDRMRLNLGRDILRFAVRPPRLTGSDLRPLTGNYVLLQTHAGYVFFAHLRKGSVRVHAGQAVREGEEIARLGNSGASIQPHLHFQLMDGPDPFQSTLLPFRFRSFEVASRGGWEVRHGELPARGRRFRC